MRSRARASLVWRAAALMVIVTACDAAAQLPADLPPSSRPARRARGEKTTAPADSLAPRWQFAWGPTVTIPHGHSGAYFAGIAPRGHGFFVDARIMLSRPPGSETPLPFRAEDIETILPLKETFENWFAIDLAYARESGFSFGAGPGVLYLGIGWSHLDVEKRYQNPPGGPAGTIQGSFWVYDGREERGRVHAIGGFVAPFMRVNDTRFGLQAAVEGPPAGVMLGLAVLQRGP